MPEKSSPMAIARKEQVSRWHKTPICYPATLKTSGRAILEIGPGRGDFLFYLAQNNPDSEVIGIELKSRRYFNLIDRTIKHGFKNVKVIQADGRYSVANDFAPESMDEIHVNFPEIGRASCRERV